MKIFIVCSKKNYDKVSSVKDVLEHAGHSVTAPNGYDEPGKEMELKSMDKEKFRFWKKEMLKKDKEIIRANDAILVLNFDKENKKNYIGGATFLEIYNAFDMDKKIYLFNPIPDGMLRDEIEGMNPIIINGDLNKIL